MSDSVHISFVKTKQVKEEKKKNKHPNHQQILKVALDHSLFTCCFEEAC